MLKSFIYKVIEQVESSLWRQRHRVSRGVYWWLWYKMYVGPKRLAQYFSGNNRRECSDPFEVSCIQWATFKGVDIEIGNTECQVMFSDYFRVEIEFKGILIEVFLEFFAEEDRAYSNVWGGSYFKIGRGKIEHPEPVRIYQFSPNSERHVTEV